VSRPTFSDNLPRTLASLVFDESGQEGLEYLLATGALAVLFASAFIAAFRVVVPQVLSTICDVVDPLGGGSCLTF
jgi:hypothetical protein